MANKQVLSVVAASILAAAFTFTGCGSSDGGNNSSSTSSVSSSVPASSSVAPSSSSEASSSEAPSSSSMSSSSSVPAQMTSVKVSDAYVINATVTVGATTLDVEADNGVYETASVVTGAIKAMNGINDLNGNNAVDTKIDENTTDYDVTAVTLQAPANFANVNPFTTLSVVGLTADNAAKIFPVASAIDATFDFDVVANPTVANEVLIAAISIRDTAAAANAAKARDILPSSLSSDATSSSSAAPVEDCTFTSDGVLPGATPVTCDGITFPSQLEIQNILALDADGITAYFRAEFPAAGTASSSSSSECDESSLLPGESCDASSSSVTSSSSSASNSSDAGGILP